MKTIKKILSGIGILALLFIVLFVVADGDNTATQPQLAGYSNEDEVDGSDDEDDNKSGASKDDNIDDEKYYTLVLDDGEKVGILKPHTVVDDIYSNMNDQRLESIFRSIYEYNYRNDDVYITYIPDNEQTLKELVKEPYVIGSVFNLDMQVTGNPGVIGTVSGYVQGDDSLGMMDMDMSYIEDEKYDLMDGDIVTFDAVYAGLDIASTPVFIALSMVQ